MRSAVAFQLKHGDPEGASELLEELRRSEFALVLGRVVIIVMARWLAVPKRLVELSYLRSGILNVHDLNRRDARASEIDRSPWLPIVFNLEFSPAPSRLLSSRERR